jgi:alcohol dehydrogenase class IV
VRPLRLSSFGIGHDDLPAIAELSFTAGRMDNNPVVFDYHDVLEILRECL